MQKVGVIGSGPAGMAAAYCLAKAGFQVTVLEKTSTIGGKVTSYEENGLSYEHGIHGWWNNYKNFTAIINDCGLIASDIFKKVNGSTMVLTSGQRYPITVLKWPLPSPLFMIWQTVTAPYLTWKDRFSLLRFGIILFGFDQKKDYEKYDKLSFQELMDECRVSKTIQDLILTPFILSYDFTIPSRVSAACGLSGMYFYVIRDQQSVCTRWLKGTPTDLIFDPMRRLLETKYGVKFLTSSKVDRLEMGGVEEKVTGCMVSSSTFQSGDAIEVASASVAAVPASGFCKLDGYNILIGKSGDAFVAFDNTCSHNGCSVGWNDSDGLFECPCHGGRYNRDGTVHSGPPPTALKQLVVLRQEDLLVIKSTQKTEVYLFDEVILATDVINAKNIMINTLPVQHSINRNLGRLDTTPVIVVRIWFTGSNLEPAIDSAITPKFIFIDNYFNLNSFSDHYDMQGHLIEVQAYRVFADLEKTDEQILQMALDDLAIINPGYNRAAVKNYRVNRHKQLFTRYAPRLNASRPKANSGIRGLYFAGDWTGFDYPVWMMERGISSGIRAANAVAKKHAARQFPLIKLDSGSWLFRFTKGVARLLLRVEEFKLSKFWKNLSLFSSTGDTMVTHRKPDADGFYFPKPAHTSWWDWTVFLLHTAAEIEHSLMVQYLFSGYSINPLFGSPQYEMVNNWKNTVLKIAVEEMGHLLVVQGVLKLLRAPLNLEREDNPFRSDLYPFPFELRRFDRQTLARFVVAELPGSPSDSEQLEILKAAKIKLNNGQVNNVGLLYEDIISILGDSEKITDECFDVPLNGSSIYTYWNFMKGFICDEVIDRATVITRLKEVAEQGEGTGATEDSHFERFIAIYREYDTLDKEQVGLIAVNTDPNPTLEEGSPNQIKEPRAVLWATVHNIKYRLTLSMLQHLLTIQREDEVYHVAAVKQLLQMVHWLMSGRSNKGGLKQVSERLFSLPLSEVDRFGLRAGPVFQLPYTLSIPDSEEGRWFYYLQLLQEESGVLDQLLAFDSEMGDAAQSKLLIEDIVTVSREFLLDRRQV